MCDDLGQSSWSSSYSLNPTSSFTCDKLPFTHLFLNLMHLGSGSGLPILTSDDWTRFACRCFSVSSFIYYIICAAWNSSKLLSTDYYEEAKLRISCFDSWYEFVWISFSDAVVFFSYLRRLFISCFLISYCLRTNDLDVERVNLFKNPRLLLLPPDRLNGLLYYKPKLVLCFPSQAYSICFEVFRPKLANPAVYMVGIVWKPMDSFLTLRIFIFFLCFLVISLVFFSSVCPFIVSLSASSY